MSKCMALNRDCIIEETRKHKDSTIISKCIYLLYFDMVKSYLTL